MTETIQQYLLRSLVKDAWKGGYGFRTTREVADVMDLPLARARRALDALHDAGEVEACAEVEGFGNTTLWRGFWPTHAISIMQPWAWLITRGWKGVENRTWKTARRGPVLIHAGLKVDRDTLRSMLEGYHPVTGAVMPGSDVDEFAYAHREGLMKTGGIVGVAEISDCVDESTSPWFVGPHGFIMKGATNLPLMPCKGALSFFPVKYEAPQ